MIKDKTIEKGASFTQGPWIVSDVIKHGARIYRTIRQKGRFKLAEVFAFNEGATGSQEGREEDKANARLIAQAPAMYEQCKLLERMLASGDLSATHDGLTNCNMLAQLREILANVDGGEG